jgi:predicted transcriptional regulator
MPKGPVTHDRRFTIRVPADLLEALAEIARVNRGTVASVARIAIERFVDAARKEAV